uniref:Ig-like domain-containing protein n=1 Tax=Amphilophus citrinellus TaxID=61819 RepID=A0A3Q0SL08_AMPCI
MVTSCFILTVLCSLCFVFSFASSQKDNVLQPKGDETAAEGSTVTLHCLYNSSSTQTSLFWYKQDGNNSPKFILSRFSGNEGTTADEFKERFSSTLDSTSRSVPLKIQKLQLSDSAVYYCALSERFV